MPMTLADAEQIAAWRYSGPSSVYDLDSSQPLIQDLDSYYVMIAGGQLVGFCCAGAAARVRGIDADPAVLDVGLGMNPAFVGRGYGVAFGRVALRHMANTYPHRATLRACIQSWNRRSLNLARRLGFVDGGEISVLQNLQAVDYRILCIRR